VPRMARLSDPKNYPPVRSTTLYGHLRAWLYQSVGRTTKAATPGRSKPAVTQAALQVPVLVVPADLWSVPPLALSAEERQALEACLQASAAEPAAANALLAEHLARWRARRCRRSGLPAAP